MSRSLPSDDDIRRHHRTLKRLAREFVRNEADAEDVAQEVWLRSVENPPRYDGSLLGWWRTVTRRVALRILSRERLRKSWSRGADLQEADPAAELDRRVSIAAVERLIARLEEPYREVLRLHFVEDLAPIEIARRLGRPDVTVRSQIKRGLDRLRVLVEDRDRLSGVAWLGFLRSRRARAVHGAFAAAVLLIVATFVALRFSRPGANHAHAEPVSVVESPHEGSSDSANPDGRVPAARVDEAAALPVIAPPPAVVEGSVSWLGKLCEDVDIFAARSPDEPGVVVGQSGPGGRYRVEIAPGNTILWGERVKRAPSGSELSRKRSRRYRLGNLVSGSTLALNLEFVYLTELRGVLLDETGKPVQGVRVASRPLDKPDQAGAQGVVELPPLASEASTDESGEFFIPIRDKGREDLLILQDGLPTYAVSVDWRAERVRVQLQARASFSGRLVGPDGAALAGAQILVSSSGSPLAEVGRTETNGCFRIEGIPPGRNELVALPGEPSLSLIHVVSLSPGEERELGDLAATSLGTIAGRATSDGAPCAGWRLWLRRRARSAEKETITGLDGSFEFKACRPGTYFIWLLPPDPADAVPRAALAGIRPGDRAVSLDAMPLTAILQARLVGDLHAGSSVLLRGEHLPEPVELLPSADQSFELRLPAGDYELCEVIPHLGEWSYGRMALAPGELRQLDLLLPRPGSLFAHVHFAPDVEPQEQLLFTLHGHSYATQFASNGTPDGVAVDMAAGNLAIDRLLPGSFSLDARAPGLGLACEHVEIKEGEESQLDIELQRGYRTLVHCRAERELLSDEVITFALLFEHGRIDRTAPPESLVGSNGILFEFRHELAAGDYELQVSSSAGLSGSLRFTVPGSRDYTLRLVDSPPAQADPPR